MFADTIENNIKFGNQEATHEQVVMAAKKACCHEFISQLPDGYNTVIGEGGATLSGGEKQRISIARAIMKDAPIIILDEATSSIDTRTEMLIQQAFDKLMEGRTSFVVAHRLSTIRNASLILVMRDGKIIEQGTHEELLAKGGFYHTLYNSQFQRV